MMFHTPYLLILFRQAEGIHNPSLEARVVLSSGQDALPWFISFGSFLKISYSESQGKDKASMIS
jgi:hypothetical protein